MNSTVFTWEFPWWLSGKGSICSAGDPSSVPVLGRSPGGGNSNLLQYSCLGNPNAWNLKSET